MTTESKQPAPEPPISSVTEASGPATASRSGASPPSGSLREASMDVDDQQDPLPPAGPITTREERTAATLELGRRW